MKLSKIIIALAIAVSSSYGFVSLKPLNIGEKEGTSGEIGISGNLARRNTDKNEYSFNGDVKYYGSDYILLGIGSYTYGEVDNEKNTNKSLVHGRFVKNIQPSLDYEIFSQAEYNEFQNIELRSVNGVNLRSKLPFFTNSYLGYGAMYSYVKPVSEEDSFDTKSRVKANIYLSMNKEFNKKVNLNYLGYYQPTLDEFSDYRVSQVLQLNTEMTTHTMIRIELVHKYDADAYPGVEKTDISTKIGLVYKFD